MKQPSIYVCAKALARRIRALARWEGISFNRAAMRLLRREAGLAVPESPSKVGGALDGFIGSWSAADERAMLQSIALVEQVDADLWHRAVH